MNPTVHFVLRTERPYSDGSAPIYMRITFNRTLKPAFSIGKNIPLKKEFSDLSQEKIKSLPADERNNLYCWDFIRERAIKGFGGMETVNLFLDDQKKRANDILYDLNRKGMVNPDAFKKDFFVKNTTVSFYDYCLKELNENRSEFYSDETKRSYKGVLSKINDFKPGAALTDITYRFLVDYENYLLRPKEEGGRGNDATTVHKDMKTIRTFMSIAVKNGDLLSENYPFKLYKLKEPNYMFSNRDFLEPDEIVALEKILEEYSPLDKPMESLSNSDWEKRKIEGVITPGEYQTLRAFLISAYTGLRFKDMMLLNRAEHLKSKYVPHPKTGERNLKYYIEIDLHKTGVNVIIPLIEKALKLIDTDNSNKITRKITNQIANRHLRRIRKKAGLQKDLTFHVARHSFATIAFEYDIPEKIVQTILGHRNKKFTEIYTHLSNKKLFFEMDKMNKGYESTEALLNELKNGKERQNEQGINLIEKLKNLDPEKLNKIYGLIELMAS